MPDKDKPLTYEESVKRLDKIVAELESNDVPLDKSIGLFEEGFDLVDSCLKKLNAFDERLQKVMKDHEAKGHDGESDL